MVFFLITVKQSSNSKLDLMMGRVANGILKDTGGDININISSISSRTEYESIIICKIYIYIYIERERERYT